MKRKLTHLLILAMILSIVFAFASCNGNTNTDTDANTNTGETNTDTSTSSGTNTDTSGTETSTSTSTSTGTNTGTNTDTDTDVLPHEHVEEIIPAVEPTCTEAGLTEGKKCSECGEILVEQEVVPAKQHVYDGSYECINCDFVLLASEGLEFQMSSKTGTYDLVSIGTCTDTDIVIPYTYNNKRVTRIYTNAFFDCTSLTSIIIPDSVTTIESGAFSGCTSLTSIIIPDSVTTIGDSAFSGCTSLTSIIIPDSVQIINSYAFAGCSSLTSITIGNNVKRIEYCAFSSCDKLVEIYDLSSLNITIGSYNDNGQLGYPAKIIHISLDEESILETVDDYIFMTWEGKYYLMGYIGNETELTLPESYNGNNYQIYEYAFYMSNGNDITKVTIPNSVTSIGSGAFDGCYSLTSVTISDSVKTIGSFAFRGTSLTNITIPDSVTSIEYYAFNACSKLVEVYNLSSLNIKVGSSDNGDAGYYAKVVHTSLDEESILETADDYIFMTWEDEYYLMGYVGNETELTLPESYNGNSYEIYQYAFYNRDDITKVTIPDSVTYIRSKAFSDCTSLTSATIGNGITSIEDSAFTCCTSLISVTIGNGIISIGDYAFEQCHSLTSITIPDSVTHIGSYAFNNCTSLISITIPDSVSSIGRCVFFGSSRLTIYCKVEYKPFGWDSDWKSSNIPVYWYRKNKPTTSGNYWHYGENGEIVVWE